MTIIKNGERIDFGWDINSIYSKVEMDYPLSLSFVPVVRNIMTNETFSLMYLKHLYDNNKCTDDYCVEMEFSIFNSDKISEELSAKWKSDEAFVDDIIRPTSYRILDLVYNNSDLDYVFNTIKIPEFSSFDSFLEFTKEIIDNIDKLFNVLSELYFDKIKDIMQTAYLKIGSRLHRSYLVNNLQKPDNIFEFGNKYCGIYRSRYETTYLLPKGL